MAGMCCWRRHSRRRGGAAPRAKPSVAADFLLSPLAKARRYGIFPWKLLLHLIIVALATYHVLLFASVRGVASRLLGQSFATVFFPDAYAQWNGDATDNPSYDRFFMFTLEDVATNMQLLADRYWSLPSVALTAVEIAPTSVTGAGAGTSAPLPSPVVEYTSFTASPETLLNPSAAGDVDLSTATATLPMTSEPGGTVFPLSLSPSPANATAALRDFFKTLVSLRYRLRFRARDVSLPPVAGASWSNPGGLFSVLDTRPCHEWELAVTYDYSSRVHVEVTWAWDLLRLCPEGSVLQGGARSSVDGGGEEEDEGTTSPPPFAPLPPHTPNPWVLAAIVATLLACSAHEALSLLAVFRSARRFSQALRVQAALAVEPSSGAAGGDEPSEDEDGGKLLPPSARVPLSWRQHGLTVLVRPWGVVTSIGVAFLLSHAAGMAVDGGDIGGSTSVLVLGTAAASLWLSLVRYVDYSPGAYAGILTLRAAAPKVARFLLGVVPLYVGFTLFSLVVFGHRAPRYANPSIAFVTIFAFFNGDALRETFTHTEATGSVFDTAVGDIHLVLTILLFMYVVANVTIALVEEAFFDTRTPAAKAAIKAQRLGAIRVLETVNTLVAVGAAREKNKASEAVEGGRRA